MGLIWQTPQKNSVCIGVVARSDTPRETERVLCSQVSDGSSHRVEIIMGHWTGVFGAVYLKSWSLCPEGEGASFLTVLLTLTYLLHFFQ